MFIQPVLLAFSLAAPAIDGLVIASQPPTAGEFALARRLTLQDYQKVVAKGEFEIIDLASGAKLFIRKAHPVLAALREQEVVLSRPDLIGKAVVMSSLPKDHQDALQSAWQRPGMPTRIPDRASVAVVPSLSFTLAGPGSNGASFGLGARSTELVLKDLEPVDLSQATKAAPPGSTTAAIILTGVPSSAGEEYARRAADAATGFAKYMGSRTTALTKRARLAAAKLLGEVLGKQSSEGGVPFSNLSAKEQKDLLARLEGGYESLGFASFEEAQAAVTSGASLKLRLSFHLYMRRGDARSTSPVYEAVEIQRSNLGG